MRVYIENRRVTFSDSAQIFVEVMLLGAIAAVLGLTASYAVLEGMASSMDEMPFWIQFTPNGRTMAFVTMITLLASAVGGILPALKATRRDPAAALQSNHRGGGQIGLPSNSLAGGGEVEPLPAVGHHLGDCSGSGLPESVGWANSAAALSVTRLGAQPSLPTWEEVRGETGKTENGERKTVSQPESQTDAHNL